MINKVVNTIIENHMFEKGDRVVVAVSGGPDSMCLLHLLYRIREKFNITICAAHVNHCIRGDEADADEDYVKNFCEKLHIQFFSKRADVNSIALQKKISSEMAGREVRYEFFEEVREEFKANKIAIAHNANDNAETILMRIIRGTGLEGMVGIRPVRDDIFVRPLIKSSRQEIEDYCKENNIRPRIDKTNLERLYRRNKIRLDLIPYIEANFNKDIVYTINRLGELVNVDNDYMQIMSYKKYNNYCCLSEKDIIIRKEAFGEHEAILSRIIRLAVKQLCGNLFGFEKKHMYDIIHLQQIGTGKKINLPGNIVAVNNYGDICLMIQDNDMIKQDNLINFNINQNNEISFRNNKIVFEIIYNKEDVSFERNSMVRYFDADKTGSDVEIRCRRTGDKFTPLGMKSCKKLKDIFINLKIPRELRDEIPLICFKNEIGWIVGHKISEKFKIDDKTKKILKIRIEREEN